MSVKGNTGGKPQTEDVVLVSALEPGVWSHIAVLYDGVTGDTQIYINGQLDVSKPIPRQF